MNKKQQLSIALLVHLRPKTLSAQFFSFYFILDCFVYPKKEGKIRFYSFCVYFFLSNNRPKITTAARIAIPVPKTYVSVCGAGVGSRGGVGTGASST
jgi:hypothetical protein